MADIKIYQSNIKTGEPEDVAKDRARTNSYTPPNVEIKIGQGKVHEENQTPHETAQDAE